MSREELELLCMNQHTQLEAKDQQLQWYQDQIKKQQKKLFGKSSEKTEYQQISLFDEAEVESTAIKVEPEIEEIHYQRKKKGKHHKDSKDLPTRTIEYTLSEEEQVCSTCGHELHVMSKNIRKELVFIPAKVEIIEHVEPIYSCRHCETKGTEATIVVGKGPLPVLKGSYASASLLAHIINEKYERALPLYRQEVQFKRMQMEISRQTMSNWILKAATQYFEKLQTYMYEELLNMEYICGDETTVTVLHEPGKESVSNTAYMWVYKSGRSETKKIVLFNYEPSRQHIHAVEYLKDYHGILQTDGYKAYDQIEGATQVGCWAHARRYIDEALKLVPKTEDKKETISYQCYTLINRLFKIERDNKKEEYKDLEEIRKKEALPIIDELYEIVNEIDVESIPKSPIKKAMTYLKNQEEKLRRYIGDGRIEISNNGCENSIRPFVIGRKNWLFMNSVKGAKSSAAIYSMVETAKANGLKPYAYIEYLLKEVSQKDITNKEEVRAYMPWSLDLPEELYEKKKS